MVHYCCVPTCISHSKTPGIKMFSFTKHKKLQKVWIHKMRLDTRKSKRNPVPFVIKPHTKVCSKHFLRSDMIIRPVITKLKPDAIPSSFPWSEPKSVLRDKCSTKDQFKDNIEVLTKDLPSSSQEQKQQLLQVVLLLPVKTQGIQRDILDVPLETNGIKSEVAFENATSDFTECSEPRSNDSLKMEDLSSNVQTEGIDMSAALDTPIPNNHLNSTALSPAEQDDMDFKNMYFDLLIEHNELKKKYYALEQSYIQQLQSKKTNFTKQRSTLTHSLSAWPNFSVDHFKDDPINFEYYTGFLDFETFQLSLDVLLGLDRRYKITRYGNSSNHEKLKKTSDEDEYFLVLLKLRHNYEYEHLATLFNLSESTVGNIFLSWINYMYIKFGSLDIWPDRKVLLENYSAEFLRDYPNVIGSLDATEFCIEMPSSLVKQSQTCSNYKGHNTVKSLIVIDANGAIIFVSPLFTGSISDKELIKQGGFINTVQSKLKKGLLQEGDTFLANKGFRIKELLDVHKINVNIPVFKVSGRQFSADEVNQTRFIAKERIHVEKAFSRLKHYKILSQTVPVSLIGTFNQIWTVCCYLSNFRSPLRADTN